MELEHSAVRAVGYGAQLFGPHGPTKALQDPLELHMEEPLAQACSSAKARALQFSERKCSALQS